MALLPRTGGFLLLALYLVEYHHRGLLGFLCHQLMRGVQRKGDVTHFRGVEDFVFEWKDGGAVRHFEAGGRDFADELCFFLVGAFVLNAVEVEEWNANHFVALDDLDDLAAIL